MAQLTLITGNEGKAREFERLLGLEVAHQKVPLPEVQDTDVAVVAKRKAEAAYAAVGAPVFVDDTGLYLNAWNNLPGALIAWFLDNVGNEGILRMLEGWPDRSARVVTALGYCDEQGSRVFIGEVAGTIAEVMRGDNGFGYDPIFVPDGQTGQAKTFAEMGPEEKDAHSMRALAAQQLRAFIG